MSLKGSFNKYKMKILSDKTALCYYLSGSSVP